MLAINLPRRLSPQVDQVLRTPDIAQTLSRVKGLPITQPVYGAARAKVIRDAFRALGWGKIFSVTKGGYSLGTSIGWATGMADPAQWTCEAMQAMEYYRRPYCLCPICDRGRKAQDALRKRVAYTLNLIFRTGRPFGNRSDYSSDYFDSDYTFYP